MKNWCMSMCKPDDDGLMSKPSDEPTKEDGLLTKKQYLGISFGSLSFTAAIFLISGILLLLKDALKGDSGIIITGLILMIAGVGAYVYALKLSQRFQLQ